MMGLLLLRVGVVAACMLMTACSAATTVAAETKTHQTTSVAGQQCPAAEFGEFLRNFASPQAAELRRHLTLDPLEYETPSGVVEERGGARLARFNYRYLKQFDLYVPEDVSTNAESLEGMRRGKFVAPVAIENESNGRYRVTFGMEYETDSYLFQRRDGCWMLKRAINLRD